MDMLKSSFYTPLPDRTRLIRGDDYDGSATSDVITVQNLRWLERKLRGVQVASVLHPDMSPGKIRSEQTKRGKLFKKRNVKLSESIRMEIAKLSSKGLSLGAISKLVGVSKSHVQYWAKPGRIKLV
jgi:Homeodomain-like domain